MGIIKIMLLEHIVMAPLRQLPAVAATFGLVTRAMETSVAAVA